LKLLVARNGLRKKVSQTIISNAYFRVRTGYLRGAFRCGLA